MPESPIDEKAIFNTARKIADTGARESYLSLACGDDAGAMQRIRDLIQVHNHEGSFLESPPPGIEPTDIRPITEQPGDVIGPYKLLQQIGEGGMGTVFMAEQSEPIERRVALKIIKPGMDTQQVIARFEAERQALAMMDHPNIAKVLDAGATDTGRPYFVMELVKGIPITRYCDQQHLSVKERLELFLPVCQAIQHAHQKGIIHRDVKPTNVLVARYDGKPIPKVIDFGVAKATSHRLTEKTMFTKYGQIVGTVEYMSPEQAEFNQLDIDTRSDIYSLGVLLYELLTGETPFDKKRLRSAAFDELLRILREEEPPRPSTRLSSSQSLPTIAANRKTEAGKLSFLVRRELDWVVMKAMEKERERRYETANGLASDLQRYLNDDPVQACPPSAGYKFRKFVRRNKAAVMGTTLAMAAVLIVAVSLIFGYRGRAEALQTQLEYQKAEAGRIEERILRQQAEEAQQAAEEAEVNARLDALVAEGLRFSTGRSPDLLKAIEKFSEVIERRPGAPQLYLYRGGAYYRSDQLQKAKEDLDHALVLQPEDNLAAHQLLAIIAQRLGLEQEAQEHLEEVQTANPDSVEAMTAQALALSGRQGLELLSKAIELDRFDPDLYLYRGEMAHAVAFQEGATPKLTRQAVADLDMARAAYPSDERVWNSLLFFRVFHRGHLNEENAEERTEDLLSEWFSHSPNNPGPKRFQFLHYGSIGDVEKAIEVGERAHLEHPKDRLIANHLAAFYARTKRYEQAIRLYDQLLTDNPTHGNHLAKRAVCKLRLGDIEAARSDLQLAVKSSDHEGWTAIRWVSVIHGFGALKDFETVEKLKRERVNIYRVKFGDDNLATMNALYDLALFLERQNRREQAEEIYDQALRTSRQINGDDHPFTIKCIERLLRLVGRVKIKRGITAAPAMLADSYYRRAVRRAEQQNYEQAASDFSRTFDLLPTQPHSGSPVRRPFYWSAFEWNEVYDRLKVIRQDDSDLPCERGLYLATRGRFAEALEAFRSGQLGGAPYRRWSHLAFLLLLNGRQEEYRLLCLQAADRYNDDLDYTSRYFLNSICTAGADSGIAADIFQQWSDRHWENGNCGANGALVAGACSFRAGRFEQAIERLQRANTRLAASESCFVRAMAYHQLNESDLSREWYERGVQALRDLKSTTINDTARYAMPYNWMRLNLEYREATDLLGLHPNEGLIDYEHAKTTAETNQSANEIESNSKSE
jgi:serine/threonine protein kinase/predicted Zn-dependent protease